MSVGFKNIKKPNAKPYKRPHVLQAHIDASMALHFNDAAQHHDADYLAISDCVHFEVNKLN
jgi:hypothetical protein